MLLDHRLGDGALLQFEASASVVVRVGDEEHERSARARFDVAAAAAPRRDHLEAEVRMTELVTADERATVELRDGVARLTIAGSPTMAVRTDDLPGMRRLDSLAASFDVDLSMHELLRFSPHGGIDASAAPGSVAGLAAFAALLTPELPERRVGRDAQWSSVHRPFPVDLGASCRARHELVEIVAGRAHVRWRCDSLTIAGIESALRGTYVIDLARGVIVELDGRIAPISRRAGSTAATVEATYSVHLDE